MPAATVGNPATTARQSARRKPERLVLADPYPRGPDQHAIRRHPDRSEETNSSNVHLFLSGLQRCVTDLTGQRHTQDQSEKTSQPRPHRTRPDAAAGAVHYAARRHLLLLANWLYGVHNTIESPAVLLHSRWFLFGKKQQHGRLRPKSECPQRSTGRWMGDANAIVSAMATPYIAELAAYAVSSAGKSVCD